MLLKLVGWYIAAKLPEVVEVEPEPGGPVAPCGMPKLRMAFWAVPELETVAAEPGARVLTVPMERVAALPAGPVGPWLPAWAMTVQDCAD